MCVRGRWRGRESESERAFVQNPGYHPNPLPVRAEGAKRVGPAGHHIESQRRMIHHIHVHVLTHTVQHEPAATETKQIQPLSFHQAIAFVSSTPPPNGECPAIALSTIQILRADADHCPLLVKLNCRCVTNSQSNVRVSECVSS